MSNTSSPQPASDTPISLPDGSVPPSTPDGVSLSPNGGQSLTPEAKPELPPFLTEKAVEAKVQQIRMQRIHQAKEATSEEDWERAVYELKLSPLERWWIWTGIPEKKGWDLFTSISLPLFVFLGGTLFTWWNNQQQQKLADDNRVQDLRIADDKQKDEVLKNYFDAMKSLLLDEKKPLRKSGRNSESRSIARTLTLTALRQLNPAQDTRSAKQSNSEIKYQPCVITPDSDNPNTEKSNNSDKGKPCNQRKALIIQFLHESGLIGFQLMGIRSFTFGNPVPAVVELNQSDLSNADLSGANLHGANLQYANLHGANLRSANLGEADLRDANLRSANLRDANLRDANLSDAYLQYANLRDANLQYANLSGADLSSAYLREAHLSDANLREADLSGAYLGDTKLGGAILIATDLRNTKNFDPTQLRGKQQPLLCNVALPKGFKDKDKLKDRDCDRLPQELLEREPQVFKSLEAAKKYVDEVRQKKWE